jgi:hypothetical protein
MRIFLWVLVLGLLSAYVWYVKDHPDSAGVCIILSWAIGRFHQRQEQELKEEGK